ncbi:DUF3343 domain-containing protein [Sporomusa rhizae]|uniref:DUF3343 domain-containing protein n=1 Tax=Sporomusa rhizae TaxID=357999 RepID=UPI00352B1407
MTYQQYDRLISFDSVHHAIKAEKVLGKHGIAIYALPTPREIDISCGQCLLFMASGQDKVMNLLADDHVRWSKLFSRTHTGTAYIYEKILECGG